MIFERVLGAILASFAIFLGFLLWFGPDSWSSTSKTAIMGLGGAALLFASVLQYRQQKK